jgi:hypothetical protein
MNFARISFNTEKCKLIVNNPINEILWELFRPDENQEQIQAQVCDVNDTIKYL